MVQSIRKQSIARQGRPPLVHKSQDGSETLDIDPYEEGIEISIGDNEDIEPLKLPEMGKDVDLFLAQAISEIQRGSLSHTSYG